MDKDLVDCQTMNILYPETFHVPSIEQLYSLQVGDYVKLIFVAKNKRKERMWVKITSIDTSADEDEFVGILNNEPIIMDLKLGDKVWFNAKHIAAIWGDDSG